MECLSGCATVRVCAVPSLSRRTLELWFRDLTILRSIQTFNGVLRSRLAVGQPVSRAHEFVLSRTRPSFSVWIWNLASRAPTLGCPHIHHAALSKKVFAVGRSHKYSAAHTRTAHGRVHKAGARYVPSSDEGPEDARCLIKRHRPVRRFPVFRSHR